MKDDSIVEEIRGVKSAHAEKYGNNIERIFAAINENEKKAASSGRTLKVEVS